MAVSLTPVPDRSAGFEELEEDLPKAFGDYLLESRIARGGMGVVYRARHLPLNRVVALKMLIGGGFAGREALLRFKAEATAAAQLHHPNIVTLYEVGEIEGLPYLSMEFVDGQDLSWLVHGGSIAPKQAARWLRDVALAVQHAHEQGILHRDLKPSNIIIDPFDQPKVTDFGLARQTGSERNLTVSGQALGSPGYMPPEQARGDHSATGPASDVYSLGAVLYHLLTGRPPFLGDSIPTILTQVETLEPIPPARLNPAIPRDLQTLCLKCLEKPPYRRYASAQELSDELTRFLSNVPIQAQAVSPLERAWRWSRRHPAIALLTFALTAAVMLGACGVLWQWRRAEAERVTASTNADVAARNEYAADLNAASSAIERGDLPEGRRLLARHDPQQQGRDLRGFEWYFLSRQAQGDELLEIKAHDSTVCAVQVSPDGQWVASGGMDHSVRLHRFPSMDPLADWKIDTVGWFIEIAPDSRRLLTPWKGDRIALWDQANRERIRDFPGRLASLARTQPWVAISTASPWFFEPAGEISVWDYESGEKLETLPFIGRAISLSPDGALLAAGGRKNSVIVWDRQARRKRFEATTPGVPWTLRFSNDGRYLAAATMDRRIQLWDLAAPHNSGRARSSESEDEAEVKVSPARAATMLEEGHWLKAWAVTFAPDNRTLLSTSSDRSLRLWSVPDLQPLGLWHGHYDEVWCGAFSPDGQRIITGGKDARLMVWNPSLRVKTTYPTSMYHAAVPFSPDGNRFLTFEQGKDINRTRLLSRDRLDRPLAEIQAYEIFAAFSPDGASVFSLPGSKGVMSVRSGHDLTLQREILLEECPGYARTDFHGQGFNPGAQICYAIGTNGQASLWDTSTGKRLRSFSTRRLPTYRTALSRDGTWLALSQTFPYDAFLYNTFTGEEKVLTGHTEYVKGLNFSPDGTQLATAGVDARIKLWEVSTGREIQTLIGHLQEVSDVAFSPDGKTLASIEGTTQFKLWRLDTYREVTAISKPESGWNIGFTPDGAALVIERHNKTIELLYAQPIGGPLSAAPAGRSAN
jgi:WD40 repeat protein